jgi:hypothetical protein
MKPKSSASCGKPNKASRCRTCSGPTASAAGPTPTWPSNAVPALSRVCPVRTPPARRRVTGAIECVITQSSDTPRRCAPPLSRGDTSLTGRKSPLRERCPLGRGVLGDSRHSNRGKLPHRRAEERRGQSTQRMDTTRYIVQGKSRLGALVRRTTGIILNEPKCTSVPSILIMRPENAAQSFNP